MVLIRNKCVYLCLFACTCSCVDRATNLGLAPNTEEPYEEWLRLWSNGKERYGQARGVFEVVCSGVLP